jgi:hypothetical protein
MSEEKRELLEKLKFEAPGSRALLVAAGDQEDIRPFFA